VFTLLLAFLLVPNAQAVDEGQTRPKLSSGIVLNSATAADVIPLTSGAGNVKAFACWSNSTTSLSNATIQIYVDGGSAQTLALSNAISTVDSTQTIYYTGYIPMNVRFGTSIKVRMTANAWSETFCSVSWGLD
jgi:hypothetical protein